MLDYGSDDIEGMDDDADEEHGQNPPFTGRWTATSSYDVYMVDTPKENNGEDKENPATDEPPKTQQSAGVSSAALNPAAQGQQHRHRRQ